MHIPMCKILRVLAAVFVVLGLGPSLSSTQAHAQIDWQSKLDPLLQAPRPLLGSSRVVLRVANAFEQSTTWHTLRSPVAAGAR